MGIKIKNKGEKTMNDLFMKLLLFFRDKGNITSANLYKDGSYSNLEVECPDGKYTISIYKEEKKNED